MGSVLSWAWQPILDRCSGSVDAVRSTITRAGDAVSMVPTSVLLTDQVAVVTGGGSGIGRGIARAFASFGASVAIWERDPETTASAAKEVGGLGLVTDVRDSAQVDAALARTT